MAEPLLSVRNLSVTFPNRSGDVHAVRGVSYDIAEGEFFGIVGESGSGKSVSSLAIMGLLPDNARLSGEIRFGGRDLLELDDRQLSGIRGHDIAIVFQDPLSALTPVYTVGDQIAEAVRIHDRAVSRQAATARAVDLLRIVGIPDPVRRASSFPHEFSGGMRQRVMIAMAIANNPRLIIADEPTTALDVTIQAQILEVLEKARAITGAAVSLITHDLGVIAGHADRVGVMYAGRLVELGTATEVFHAPTMPYTIGLLRSVPNIRTAGSERLVSLAGRPPSLGALPRGCPFADRCPLAIEVCRQVEPPLVPPTAAGAAAHPAACHRADEIASGKIGRAEVFPVADAIPASARVPRGAEPVLSVRGLKRHFPLLGGGLLRRPVGTVRAVDGVSFEVAPGRTFALVGESGCGKTTTVLEVMELAKPQEGEIRVEGTDVATLGRVERRTLRADIQMVFQDAAAAVDPRLPVGDVIAEPLLAQRMPRADRDARVAELLELVGLDRGMAERYPHEFSGGQRQRIGIARGLATRPKILVLDEPVSALDVSVQAGIINLLEDLKVELGLAMVFVAHDLAIVRQIADEVGVMYLGRIIEQGPIAEVFGTPRHPYTQALMSAAPIPDPAIERTRERIVLEGDLPSPAQRIDGCRFRTRCPLYRILDADARALCDGVDPELEPHGDARVACHHVDRNPLVVA
ncbi:MAG: putative transporter ATP-binding protein [Naasia sp.]|uniref:ABC transporter ATP-binding protein n=1 Tax=Naasia sp. TaxID=2546198 RepID=UPI002604F4B6|nr:ABC transporter ATP-binding protein [Naasia sp.]MCU1570146.1 putative transporter ATP-binding protein [Naasia sp.]